MPLVPCHNDLNPGNIFIKKDKVIFIDWGDSAIANPYYDIAIFFVLNSIPEQQQNFFLEQYNKKLLASNWQEYLNLLKNMVHFEFALNLLRGVQEQKPELLFKSNIEPVKQLDYYLDRLSKEPNLTTDFLYEMAIASLLSIRREA